MTLQAVSILLTVVAALITGLNAWMSLSLRAQILQVQLDAADKFSTRTDSDKRFDEIKGLLHDQGLRLTEIQRTVDRRFGHTHKRETDSGA